MNKKLLAEDIQVAVVGLGYVGLPLAAAFGRHYSTVGFDIDHERISELLRGHDSTLEVSGDELAEARLLRFSGDPQDIASCNVYIVTVPTPIDRAKRPDLSALRSASHAVGQILSEGDVVIYESTVYPGATEEDCAPILEQISGLRLNKDFSFFTFF